MSPLLEALVESLREGCGLSDEEAMRLARGALDWGATKYAGEAYYWPKACRALTRDEIKRAVKREFTGGADSVERLCQTYSISKSQVYRLANEPA
ncbi:MAG TPA: hypothetical protein DD491_03895 [Halieaceae bacterium]|nr:hypothetical protein [Halieaceae bacterium]